jgi:ribosomal protein S18 acetylase RimI-like enzyme
MHIIRRPLLNDDLPAVLALADYSPLGLPHLADWPYRFASWALDQPENAQVWLDDLGRLLGWAVLQTPFWAMDCIMHPDAPSWLYREMLAWAMTRAQALTAAGAGRPMWFVSIAASCSEQRRELEALGFVDVSDDEKDPWSKVLFALPEGCTVTPVALPSGMAIRSLRVPEEVDAYVALHRAVFESDSMRRGWRERTTQMPGYRNALDLVLVSEPGELCGFCVAWLRERATGTTVGQIEPLGIGAPYRGRRLSQALLAEAVRRLREQGAGQVVVETDRQREAAMAAYAAMGFAEAHEVRVYRHDVPQASPRATHDAVA